MKENTPTPTTTEIPRRHLLFSWLWKCVAAIGILELSWVVGSLFHRRSRNRKTKEEGSIIINAGMLDQYKPGDVKAVPEGKFYLVCLEDGSFLALSRTCTHLGCSVPWHEEQKKFICPCHGSTFDEHGVVLTPPAIRPLDYFPVKIENGLIRVDISQARRRDSFDASQTQHS
ncbi:ubiquinol-cytochrome c reductase iron-sulfur subunit [Desulfopila sp. IMCC35008]|uniref:QcrA and Rieske domain-containing protein n=1 Tax=Desulfopila sp. IMCC35008 TaxID=2653858 RepID=UPI0013CF7147|nr:Rieske (2Fe-2S) protein [Desulfopila sp. IMCC35008]